MKSLRRISCILVLATAILLASAGSAAASAPALKVAPLMYRQTIQDNTPKIGYVDVSNPTDGPLTINTQVQAFRQINLSGNLEYYDDPAIAKGIKFGLMQFTLGPREAYRVAFTVDPRELPKGGVYAALFFQTVPPPQNGGVSFIAESAKVGSLLVITNGNGERSGTITGAPGPFQFGSGITGTLAYRNDGQPPMGVAYNPQLSIKAGPFGEPAEYNGPLIFPGNTRSMDYQRPGDYFGIFPLVVEDRVTGKTSYHWMLVVTGNWRPALAFLVPLLAFLFWRHRHRLRHPRRRRGKRGSSQTAASHEVTHAIPITHITKKQLKIHVEDKGE